MKFQMLHPHGKSLLLINQLIAELITQLCNQPKKYSLNFANIFVHMAPTSLEKCWKTGHWNT